MSPTELVAIADAFRSGKGIEYNAPVSYDSPFVQSDGSVTGVTLADAARMVTSEAATSPGPGDVNREISAALANFIPFWDDWELEEFEVLVAALRDTIISEILPAQWPLEDELRWITPLDRIVDLLGDAVAAIRLESPQQDPLWMAVRMNAHELHQASLDIPMGQDAASALAIVYSVAVLYEKDASRRSSAEGHPSPDSVSGSDSLPATPVVTDQIVLIDSFQEEPGLLGTVVPDVEAMLAALTHLAQDDATPDDLSLRATQLAKRGRSLFVHSDDEPLEVPPEPGEVYGWTVSAIRLLKTASSPDPDTASAVIVEAIAGSTPDNPSGVRDAVEQVAKDPRFRDQITRAARDGASKGVGSGTEKLFDRIIAHPWRTVAGTALALDMTLALITRDAHWIAEGLRILVKLVKAATAPG